MNKCLTSLFKSIKEDASFNLCAAIFILIKNNVLQSFFNILIDYFVFLRPNNLVNIWNNEISLCGIIRNKNSTDRFVLKKFLHGLDIICINASLVWFCAHSDHENDIFDGSHNSLIHFLHLYLGINILKNRIAEWDSKWFVILLFVETVGQSFVI